MIVIVESKQGAGAKAAEAMEGEVLIRDEMDVVSVNIKNKTVLFKDGEVGYDRLLRVNGVRIHEVENTVPAEDIKRVKGLGFLQDKRYPDVFNGRVLTVNGRVSAEDYRTMTEACERFGSNAISLTVRLTMEVQGVAYQDIDSMIDFLAERGLETGGTGALVRPVVSCKGTTCQFGLIDTYGISQKMHEKFYKGYHTVKLPHKFKIAVGGCPNNCAKPDLNDLGVIGQRVPMFDLEKCKGCKKCKVVDGCPIKIATQDENGILTVNATDCNHCGRCMGKCPFGVTETYLQGYKIYIGGRWGKRTALGTPLDPVFTSEEEVMEVTERAISFFRDYGNAGERFADVIERLGFDFVQAKLLSE